MTVSREMKSDFLVLDNPLIIKARKKDNYKVIYNPTGPSICYVFFSSNGLFYPDDQNTFEHVVGECDRYEWEHIYSNKSVYSSAKKFIFIRDVLKSYYLEGISEKNNSIEKVLELVKDLTKGYDVITIGSSAGAYIAMLIGKEIRAKHVISISGIFSLTIWNDLLNSSYINRKDDKNFNRWFDLTEYLYETPVFYFFPGKNKKDYMQYLIGKKIGTVRSFEFNEKIHGKTMYSENLVWIISQDTNVLDSVYEHYKNKIINKNLFCIRTMGVGRWIRILMKKFAKRIIY